jgi:hypothetical protein
MASCGLEYGCDLLYLLFGRHEKEEREMKACKPRNLIKRCLDIFRYERLPPTIIPEIMEGSSNNYFGSVV